VANRISTAGQILVKKILNISVSVLKNDIGRSLVEGGWKIITTYKNCDYFQNLILGSNLLKYIEY